MMVKKNTILFDILDLLCIERWFRTCEVIRRGEGRGLKLNWRTYNNNLIRLAEIGKVERKLVKKINKPKQTLWRKVR